MRAVLITTLLGLGLVSGCMPPPESGSGLDEVTRLSRLVSRRSPVVFIQSLTVHAYRDHLEAVREWRVPGSIPDSFGKYLPKLVAARAAEIQILDPIVVLLRAEKWPDHGARYLTKLNPEQRRWLKTGLEGGMEGLITRWVKEADTLDDKSREFLKRIIFLEASKTIPPDPFRFFRAALLVVAAIFPVAIWRARRRSKLAKLKLDQQTPLPAVSGVPPNILPAGLQTEPAIETTSAQLEPLRAMLTARYDDLEILGAGAMGLVIRARDRILKRNVAIKAPLRFELADPEIRARFLQEARTLAAVSHPAIVRIHEINPEPPMYYTMELIDGQTLDALRENRPPLAVEEALELLTPIASALAACHEAGILHRDIKPANIVIDTAGRSHLMDFGIALREADPRLTSTGVAVGTPAYMAPEVLDGDPHTTASDIYGWGLLFYELIRGDTFASKRRASERLTEDLPPLEQSIPGLSLKLEQLIMDCVAREKKRRPVDGGALVRRLDELSASLTHPQAELDACVRQLQTIVAGDLHLVKNRSARTGELDSSDRERLCAIREQLLNIPRPVAIEPAVAARLEALGHMLEPDQIGAVGRVYNEATAVLDDLALPIRRLLTDVTSSYGPRVRLLVDLPPPPVYLVERQQAGNDLRVIIANWIENGLEAGAEQVDVVLGCSGTNAEVARVTVRNDGPPFPPEQRESAFREPIPQKGPGRGTGLLTTGRLALARGWAVQLEEAERPTFILEIPHNGTPRHAPSG
jgi:tRNA A-37 threonylcarbamoyl transferase component Bud32